MPDKHGFNHLGDDVRCIDCSAGGPLGRWSEQERARHARTHGRTTTSDLRRKRPLLTASPPTRKEEKEATMATTKKSDSAKQVAIDVLRESGEPLHAKEIAKRVLASGRCAGLKGKTPEATVSAMLAVGSKLGGPFVRVDKGIYALAETSAVAAAQPQPASRASKARQTKQGSKRSATKR